MVVQIFHSSQPWLLPSASELPGKQISGVGSTLAEVEVHGDVLESRDTRIVEHKTTVARPVAVSEADALYKRPDLDARSLSPDPVPLTAPMDSYLRGAVSSSCASGAGTSRRLVLSRIMAAPPVLSTPRMSFADLPEIADEAPGPPAQSPLFERSSFFDPPSRPAVETIHADEGAEVRLAC